MIDEARLRLILRELSERSAWVKTDVMKGISAPDERERYIRDAHQRIMKLVEE